MFSLKNRGKLDRWVQDEFEHLFARLRGFLSVSHSEDGAILGLDTSLTGAAPIGGIIPFAGPVAPAGWLICNGAAVSRITYKQLFEVIGTTYGAGDGATTFHLPDLRQRFPLGVALSGTGAVLGSAGGAIDHTHTTGDHTHSLPDHTHSISGSTSSEGNHNHSGSGITAAGGHTHSMSSAGSHNHAISDITLGPSDDNISINTGEAPPILGASHSHSHSVSGGSTSTEGSHTHSIDNVTDHTHGLTINADGVHSHTVSGSTGSGGSGTTGSGGAGATSTANPPFLALHYIIFAGA